MHAAAIETILSEQFYRRLSPWMDFFIILAAAGLISLLTLRSRPILGLLIAMGIVIVYLILAYWLFIAHFLVLDTIAPAGAVFVCHAGNMLAFFMRERLERQRIRGMFAMYVPDKVIKVLTENPELMNLGGEERELSILFSDLAGFTPFAESLPPGELVEWLNEYLSEMTDIVLAHDGIIDKYEGDLIMAEFGAPLADPEHALKACRAALAMQKRLGELRERWRKEGRAALHARIGLCTGSVVLGNMGSRAVHDYTVIGDAVNLASRLEGANKVFGSEIMISETTYEQAREGIVCRELDLLRVKGKRRAVTVYELVAMRDDPVDALRDRVFEAFDDGLEAYRSRRWREAGLRFAAALDIDPEDGPSRAYLDRARHFRDDPPDEDWDRSFTMIGK
jgi:adenylate cyclase